MVRPVTVTVLRPQKAQGPGVPLRQASSGVPAAVGWGVHHGGAAVGPAAGAVAKMGRLGSGAGAGGGG
jgi:hypothetical protein